MDGCAFCARIEMTRRYAAGEISYEDYVRSIRTGAIRPGMTRVLRDLFSTGPRLRVRKENENNA